MKLAIDCRGLRTAPTGIPNFVVTAINGIAKQKPDWQLYLLSNTDFNEDLGQKLVKTDNIYILIEPLKIVPNIGIVWYCTKLNFLLNKIQPDIFWAPAFLLPPFIPNNVKTIVTVHDLVFKQHRHTMSGMNRVFFELLHDRSVKMADMIWVNSDYTKTGVEQYFKERKCNQIFKGFFINTALFRRIDVGLAEKQSLLQKYNIAEKFLLFVGTLEPRKNLSYLLSIMPQLVKDGFSLLVVGGKGWGETHIKEIVEAEGYPRDKVCFAGFVSTEELIKLYNLASVYVSTSYNEGFGMPQLEAMACGCPVVSPHNSAMIEVVEGAGETVKDWCEEEWVATIKKVERNRQMYVTKGLKRVSEYSREKVISNLINYITKGCS